MRVIWGNAPATANDVVEALSDRFKWKPKTIKTLLSRLVGKKALAFEKSGRAYRYYPLVREDQCIEAQRRSFLRRVYDGALTPMLAAFLEDSHLTQGEIAKLRSILDRKDKV